MAQDGFQDIPVNIVTNNLIYRGEAGTPTANSCFPSVVRMARGELLLSWRVGSQKDSTDGAIWMTRSANGTNWTAPQQIIAAGLRGGVPGEPHYGPLTALGDGRLLCTVMWVDRSKPDRPFFNPTTEGLLPLQTLILESRDAGETWQEIGRLDDRPYDAPLAITGPVIELGDGSLACPFEVNKRYDDSGPWRHAAALKFSYDGGRTWPEIVEIANDPSGQLMYWDAHVVAVDKNRCLATFWTFDREQQCDRTIHLAESTDFGRTWSVPRDLGIAGQVSELVPLGHGRLLLIYVDRFGTRSIRSRLSVDGGKTFDEQEIVIHQQPLGAADAGQNSATADYLQDMSLWTFGRVQAVADAPGSAWVVYYAGDTSCTGIYVARLKVESPNLCRV